MNADIETLAKWIATSRRIVALTGAGVSTESGIPDFRSASSGLWERFNPMEVASIHGFLEDPRRFYTFWKDRFAGLRAALPNVTHHLLAGLERQGGLSAVITQNIDGLHGRAGSERVLEVHGNFERARCLQCNYPYETDEVASRTTVPTCEACGGLVKPDVVLFGEALPEKTFAESAQEAEAADLMLVLGTSLEVYPVAGLVPLARRTGAKVVVIDRDPNGTQTGVDLLVRAELGAAMRALDGALGGVVRA